MKFYAGKRILITGGDTDFGRACAELLIEAGASVSLIARRPAGLKAVLAHLQALAKRTAASSKVVGYSADVASYRAFKSAYRKCRRASGVPDVLINCAGLAGSRSPMEPALARCYRLMESNYYGTVHGVQAVLPDLLRRGPGGLIVNVASLAGLAPESGSAEYSASRYAVVGYSGVLRRALRSRGVRVYIACPPDSTPDATRLDARAVARIVLRGATCRWHLIVADASSRWRYGLRPLAWLRA